MTKLEEYQISAKKYRPRNFSDLISHDNVITILSNSIIYNKIAQAFLLSGTRGTGKTTIARIIARTINCTNLQIVNKLAITCNTCPNCQSYEKNNHPDFIELDAASKTGVGDIREIIDSMKYSPLLGKYKIYIIDEVHMLSTSAFSALLKTLEEPPKHIKIIFATTEIKKIPLTIISRCQKFNLKPIEESILTEFLINIAKKENFQLEYPAANLIAEAATGSARDALSLLDTCFAAIENRDQNVTINLELAKDILSINSLEITYQIIDYIIKGETNFALEKYDILYSENSDIMKFLEDFLEILLLTIKFFYKDNIKISEKFDKSIISYLSIWTKLSTIERLTIFWQIITDSISDVKYLSFPKQAVEILIINLCHMKYLSSPTEIKNSEKIDIAKEKISNLDQITTNSKLNNFQQLTDLFKANGEYVLYHYLREDIKLNKFSEGYFEINISSHLPKDFINKVQFFLKKWTNINWNINIIENNHGKTLKDEEILAKKKLIRDSENNNEIIQNIYEKFPGSEVTDIRKII